MKKIGCGILAVCLLLSASGCSPQPPPGPKGVGAVLSADSHRLTKEQMLADYDAMWRDIGDNYPLMGVAARTTKKDFKKVQDDYRGKMAGVKSDGEFFEELSDCIKEFKGTGHLSVLDEKRYASSLSIYKKYNGSPKGKYLYRVLDNPASRTFYSSDGMDTYEIERQNASKHGGSGNLTVKIPEEGQIAYLGIKSFGSELVEVDAPKIKEFFQKIRDYRYCILDIRGNGGGDSTYWMDHIVSPNLTQKVVLTSYELVKGEAAKQYLSTVSRLHPISAFEKMPATNRDDLAEMKYFIQSEFTVGQTQRDKAFHGSFYLLTDGKVYSSSEAFATFCRQTGFAKLVGKATGGDGMGTDPMLFALPNSGAILRFSASLGLNPDGGSNEEFGTTPDYPCAPGRDALQACLDLIHAGRGAAAQ